MEGAAIWTFSLDQYQDKPLHEAGELLGKLLSSGTGAHA
jgi:hypothetical protein